MANETQSAGDGILADQGLQDLGSLIGSSGGGQQTQQTQQTQHTPAQRVQTTTPNNGDVAQEQQQEGVINMRRARPGAVEDGGQTQQGGEGQTQQGDTTQAAQQGTQATTSTQPDIQAIIRATADSVAANMRQNVPAQAQTVAAPQQLSAEEFDRKYGIVRPSEEMVTHLIGQDPKRAVQVLNTLFQANLSASLRMANDVMEAKLQQMQEKLNPDLTAWRSHQQELASDRAEKQFFVDHKDLAGERELVMEMKDALLAKVQAGQIQFKTQAEANLAVANATRAILKRFQTNGGQTQQGQSQGQGQGGGGRQSTGSGRQMSTASSAGRTGTGQAAAKSVVDEVFGADAR